MLRRLGEGVQYVIALLLKSVWEIILHDMASFLVQNISIPGAWRHENWILSNLKLWSIKNDNKVGDHDCIIQIWTRCMLNRVKSYTIARKNKIHDRKHAYSYSSKIIRNVQFVHGHDWFGIELHHIVISNDDWKRKFFPEKTDSFNNLNR